MCANRGSLRTNGIKKKRSMKRIFRWSAWHGSQRCVRRGYLVKCIVFHLTILEANSCYLNLSLVSGRCSMVKRGAHRVVGLMLIRKEAPIWPMVHHGPWVLQHFGRINRPRNLKYNFVCLFFIYMYMTSKRLRSDGSKEGQTRECLRWNRAMK